MVLEKKIYYFEKPGKENTNATINAAFERAKENNVKQLIVATYTGETALKVAKKFKETGIKIVAIGFSAVDEIRNPERKKAWEQNIPKLESLGVKCFRGLHSFSGVERGLRKRWNGVTPLFIIADVLRMFGEGTKVGVEIAVMAAEAGLIDVKKQVMTISGSGGGADTCLIIQPNFAENFFDSGIKEIICKPLSKKVIHEAR